MKPRKIVAQTVYVVGVDSSFLFIAWEGSGFDGLGAGNWTVSGECGIQLREDLCITHMLE